MDQLVAYTVIGIVTGSVYAVGASGLVLTYATSGIFNIAHGAIGMVMAFTYWHLLDMGMPTLAALALVLLVIAPLFGAAIERVLMRGLRNVSFGTSLVVTVGLMVGLIGAANSIWPQDVGRTLKPFFGSESGRTLGPVFVSYHEMLTIVIAAGVAVALWLFLSRTRTGIAMRAVVDNRDLIALNGARPDRISMFSWAIGASLAALAGILIAPSLQLSVLILTLLVINAYAAAMVGRLKSLPLTFVGALILGLIESYAIGFLDLAGWLGGLRFALPTLFLFAILLLLPQDRLRAGRLTGARSPRIPDLRRSLQGGALLVAIAIVLSFIFDASTLSTVGEGLAFALVMLSLVLLTGYGGQVSLAQMTFAGLGAFAMARFGADGSFIGLILAMVIAGLAGAVVTLPALRLQGLYLALATMAFAVFMDQMVFPQGGVFGFGVGLPVGRLDIFGISFDSEGAFIILLAITFALAAVAVLAIRRGPFGRLLGAMRDSEVACATLGLSLARTKFAVFSLSAAIAGLGGAMFGAVRQTAGPVDFVMLQSLPILLLAVIGGISTVSGALIGGVGYAVLRASGSSAGGMVFLLIGAVAVTLGRNPNGLAHLLSQLVPGRREPSRPPAALTPETAEEGSRVVAPAG